jgi:hypothetical protein
MWRTFAGSSGMLSKHPIMIAVSVKSQHPTLKRYNVTHDLFDIHDIIGHLPAHTPTGLTPALHTTTDAVGVRTLTHCGDTVGHYHRARKPHLWRGVTHGGELVYGRTEPDVRAALLELYA